MNINVPSEIGAVLSELAAKLGVAAEYLGETILAAPMTTAMPPAFPPALRDKMLRLMGGCEHTWRPAADAHTYECECGMTWQSADLARQPLPTVGDGHEPTMEELMDLAKQRWGPTGVSIRFYFDEHGCSVDIYADGDNGTQVVDCFAEPQPTPLIALTTAIDAATKEKP